MAGGINQGAYHPLNLGLYSYAWNNPIILRDQNGAWPSLSDVGDFALGVRDRAVGLAIGVGQAVVPGAFLLDLSPHVWEGETREFLEGKALGQSVVGAVETGVGSEQPRSAAAVRSSRSGQLHQSLCRLPWLVLESRPMASATSSWRNEPWIRPRARRGPGRLGANALASRSREPARPRSRARMPPHTPAKLHVQTAASRRCQVSRAALASRHLETRRT